MFFYFDKGRTIEKQSKAMKIIHSDFKQGEVKLRISSLNDLWYLSHIIDKEDIVKASTERKIIIGNKETEKARTIRKKVFLAIRVEKLEFQKNSSNLRISGVITEAPEDMPKGDYHTINVEENSIITIVKNKWLNFQIDKLKEAATILTSKILITIFDREEAIFALLKTRGHEILSRIKGDVTKKGFEEKKGNFYKEIVKSLQEYDKRYGLDNIIVASPSFWKEYLMKEVPEELKKKIILAGCSHVEETAIDEVLKRPELKTVLEKDKTSKELKLVDELLEGIAKKNAFYGFKEAKEKLSIGNVEKLLVTDTLIQKYREEGNYEQLDELMKQCENLKANVNIISSEEASRKIDGLGGIAGILRWKEDY